MNFRWSGLAACLLAAVTAGCGTVTASSSGGGAHPTATAGEATASAVHTTASAAATKQSQVPSAVTASTGARSGCQRPAGDVVTLASNGKTYCVKVGEKFDVYLRGTVASRWLVPLASSDVIKPVPNGALSLIAGLTGESFAGVRRGRVFITSLRPPCAGAMTQKNEIEPAFPLPKTYPLHACAPQRRFSVTVVVLG
jgi:hypothetical protein